jgi:two-component system cell cycle sensor histidine kinase/response regulator CckA
MKNQPKTKQALIQELVSLKQRNAELEQSEAERRQAEEELQNREKELRSIFRAAPIGIGMVIDRVFQLVNSTLCSMTGYTREELLGQGARMIYPTQEDFEYVGREKYRQIGEKQTGAVETRWLRKDGTIIDVLLSSSPLDPADLKKGVTFTALDITDRKRTEDALRERDIQFKKLSSWVPGMIYQFTKRPDGTYCVPFTTEAIKNIFGCSPQDVRDDFSPIARVILPDDFDRVVGSIEYSAKHLSTWTCEYRVQIPGQAIRWMLGNSTPEKSADGSITWYGFNYDITDRKKTEEALRESEEKYRAIIENMQEGYHEVDIKGNFTFFNEAMCRILGYEREELLGMNNRQYADELNTRRVYQVYNRVYRTGEPVKNFEWQIIRKDGDRRDIDVSISLIRDAEGHPTGFRGIVRDITERKRAEEKLHESKEQYRLLVENANDAIFIAQDGVIKFPNTKTLEILGYTAEDLARIPFTQHIHPEDRDMVVERHRKRLQGEPLPPVYSFRVLNRSGEELWFEISAVSVGWEGRLATLNFMRDVTEQKKLEAQLLQAQKMEAVGTLAGGLAHDFNNLLSGILGNASLAKTGMDPSDQNYGRLQNIETIVDSAAGLTRQLLAFSRGGRVEVRASNINEVVEKTATIFSRTKKEVAIHRNLEKDIWPAEVDRGQMEQVFMNLFVNAWQAMPGGGKLYLDTVNTVLTETDLKHPYMKTGRYVKVSVTDTGTGMDEKTRVRIFEPFFTTREMGRGTGLGLAMVYGIVKGHNGYINVYSEPGRGTTFSIYLPASEKEVPREAPLFQGVLRGTETILIVDDEQMNLDVSKEILNLLGYTVHTAANGQEALAMYTGKKEEIDLILLDMIMPGMSGGETYDRMKELNPDIRVILCSGYSIDGDAQKIMDRGCNGFIQKPFNLSDLSQKIREVLDKKN